MMRGSESAPLCLTIEQTIMTSNATEEPGDRWDEILTALFQPLILIVA